MGGGRDLKRLALLLVLAISACAPSQGGGPGGPPLRPRADPSAVIAAEIGFSQLAQAKGQWTAFRETAARGAELFVPERVSAEVWLKGRADPTVPVRWQPHAVWSSCDGSHAVTRGAWERPGSAGRYVTVWQRQKDGQYKWQLDMSLADERAPPMPEMVAARVADCGKSPEQRASLAAIAAAVPASAGAYDASSKPIGSLGIADDATLGWESRAEMGDRRFKLLLWNGKEFETVIDTSALAPPR